MLLQSRLIFGAAMVASMLLTSCKYTSLKKASPEQNAQVSAAIQSSLRENKMAGIHIDMNHQTYDIYSADQAANPLRFNFMLKSPDDQSFMKMNPADLLGGDVSKECEVESLFFGVDPYTGPHPALHEGYRFYAIIFNDGSARLFQPGWVWANTSYDRDQPDFQYPQYHIDQIKGMPGLFASLTKKLQASGLCKYK
jgi:hypothetical protein